MNAPTDTHAKTWGIYGQQTQWLGFFYRTKGLVKTGDYFWPIAQYRRDSHVG
jgi:hypothetical protein